MSFHSLSLLGAIVLLVSAPVTVSADSEQVFRIPIDGAYSVGCLDSTDTIDVVGEANVVAKVQSNSSGGFNVIVNWSKKGMGIGSGPVLGGIEYRYNEVLHSHFKSSESGQFVITDSVTFNLISAGNSPNLVSKESVQLTVNANGVITVDRYETNVHCQ